LTFSHGRDIQPAWSPDGTQLVFVSDRSGSWDLYTMPSVGGAATPITRDANTERGPSWTPDGTAVVFASDSATGGGGSPSPSPSSTPSDSPSPSPSVSPSPTPTPTPTPTPSEPPGVSGAAWGIFSEPRNGHDGQTVIDELEARIGRDFTGQR